MLSLGFLFLCEVVAFDEGFDLAEGYLRKVQLLFLRLSRQKIPQDDLSVNLFNPAL